MTILKKGALTKRRSDSRISMQEQRSAVETHVQAPFQMLLEASIVEVQPLLLDNIYTALPGGFGTSRLHDLAVE